MKHLWKLMAWLLVLGLTTAGVYWPVQADDETEDLNKKCSITLNIDAEKKANGGEFSAYQITTLEEVDGKYQFKGIYGDITYDLDTKMTENLSKSFQDLISEKDAEPTATAAAKEGQLKFEDLDPGYYLIMQSKAITGYSDMSPCLLVVPGTDEETGAYIFDVVSDTKAKVTPNPEEGTTEPPEEGTTEPPVEEESTEDDYTEESEENDERDYSESDDSDSSSSKEKLPQTGQLWWPLPILLCAGLVLMLVGRRIRK